MPRFALVAVLFCFCLGTPQAALSTPILDQEYFPAAVATPGQLEFSMHASIWAGLTRTQTFTVGLDGWLTGIALLLVTYGEPTDVGQRTFDIVSTTSGLPNTAAGSLGSATVQFVGDTFGGYFTGTFSVPIEVHAGDVLAIVDFGGPGGEAYWVGNYDNDALNGGTPHTHYAGGAAYYPGWSNDWVTEGDLGFRTFVEPSAVPQVPEPGSLLLLGSGLIGLARLRKRRG